MKPTSPSGLGLDRLPSPRELYGRRKGQNRRRRRPRVHSPSTAVLAHLEELKKRQNCINQLKGPKWGSSRSQGSALDTDESLIDQEWQPVECSSNTTETYSSNTEAQEPVMSISCSGHGGVSGCRSSAQFFLTPATQRNQLGRSLVTGNPGQIRSGVDVSCGEWDTWPRKNNNHLKVFLPHKLIDSLPKCAALPKERQRWNTNEEIVSYLTSFEKHEEWLSGSPRTRPLNGSIILYNRKKVKYRKDGYCWKKRKDGKTTREDHMKLKVQGMECLYGCYVHSSIIPTFHRRCYWLLQNPDIVLVHYLNVPVTEDCGKICGPMLSPSSSDRKEWLRWSKEELICQLKPMFHCIKWTCSNGNGSVEFSVEQLVHQVLESQPPPRTHMCLFNSGLGSRGNIPHKCNSTKHRIISPKVDFGLAPCSALTEVQNLSAANSSGNVVNQDKKLVKLPKSVPRVKGGREASPLGTSDNVDPTDRTPGARSNGSYGNRELTTIACVTNVPNLSIATVTCSIPRNALILMTGVGDKPVSLAGPGLALGSQQLAVSGQAAGLGSRDLTLALAHSTGSGLVLSETSMDTSETSTTFDPDSFLNSPKQGQTYGGGGGAREGGSIAPAYPVLSLGDSLEREADLESVGPERESRLPDCGMPPVSSASVFPQTPGLMTVRREPTAATVCVESPALATVLDYNDRGSPKPYAGTFPQPSPMGAPLPSPCSSFFHGDAGGHGSGSDPSAPVILGTEPLCQFSQEATDNRGERNKLGVGGLQAVGPEAETPMDTSQGTGLQKGAEKVEPDYGALPTGNSSNLYSIIQSEMPPTQHPPASLELDIDHFDISFDSQFPDLIPDFMAEGGGEGGTAYPSAESSDHTISPTYPETLASRSGYSSPQQPMGTDRAAVFSEVPAAPADLPSLSPSTAPEGPSVSITDFSPEWSYPEGGVKVLITGQWGDGADGYSCVFDHITVPAALIQSGVLRCYCPAHEAGVVKLHVTREKPPLVSNTVMFEYRARNSLALPSSQLDWLSLDDNQFRMSILERLEQMEKRMAEMAASGHCQSVRTGGRMQIQASSDSFEERIIALCLTMMSRSCWLSSERLVHSVTFRGMTLLHLAAAQGYSRLIETLIKWRSLSADSLDLEQEVDPLNVDHFSCTPLMWACALGHVDAAVTLYGWNQRALLIPDSLGRLPLHVARARGHVRLATRLEELQGQGESSSLTIRVPEGDTTDGQWPLSTSDAPDTPRGPLSSLASPDTGLSVATSPSSPSSLPEGLGANSVSSAYSSASVSGESATYSPELGAHGDPDIAMEVCESQQMVGPASPGGKGDSLWPLPSQQESRQRGTPSPTPQSRYFIDYGLTHGNGQFSVTIGRDSIETGLLRFNENEENEEFLPPVDVLQVDMMALAEQIIEATPERIKQEDFNSVEAPLKERQDSSSISNTMTWLATYLENVDQLPNFSQHRSACNQPLTPPSHACLSPVNSPLSDITFERVDVAANTGWSDFFNASTNGKMESEFALLTLSDHEQRELYEAARIIQTAFRKYKGRRLKEQQEVAAAVIQRCYRKYKQYALYKKMTQAAILIQSKFRSYYEQKRFQQSRRAAVLIQQSYRSYKEYERLKQAHRGAGPLQQKMKASFLTKKQDQAARKIMRFLRRCRHRMRELRQSQELEAVPIPGLTT
ncbi:calmodulin-binding transcription activator 2-like isoform X3 [Mobula birostris]